MVRGKDGQSRAFMNVCSHRGATLATQPKGNCARFVCPYHAWTFNDQGVLMGVADRAKFRSEEHTSVLQSLMRTSYSVFCLKKHKSNYTSLLYTLLRSHT